MLNQEIDLLFEAGEQVLDLVIPYIHNVEDKNSVSLVSHKCYATDSITRKRVTVHVRYYPNPASLRKRFPFIESLTLRWSAYMFLRMRMITPWIEQLALAFRYLKELHLRGLVVYDEDLETLARTRGKDLRILKINKCSGFSAHGLRHVSNYCNQLRAFCLIYPNCNFIVKDTTWLHELALKSKVLERLHIKYTLDSYVEDITLLAKNCSNSLISLKIGECNLSKLGDAFRYAVRLEHFGVHMHIFDSGLVGFQFAPNTCSLSIEGLIARQHTSVLPFLNQIRKLKFGYSIDSQWLLIQRCPNLEVLYTKDEVYTEDECGDKRLQVIGKFCKKLRKLTYNGHVTQVGLISLAKECTKLECLKVRLEDISNEALECLGRHLKNLRKFCMNLDKKGRTTHKPLDNGQLNIGPLDNGIRAMLMGCSKLERVDISLWYGELRDLGLEYIGKYGANLRSLALTRIRNSNAGLLKLSEGCPRLRKLKLRDCSFSKQLVASSVFNIPTLRYVYFYSHDGVRVIDSSALTRPEFQL